jgi:DNA-binding LytR/AlgR family response regulator
MKTRCIIVDDEPLARRVLQKYIASLPSLELVKECGSALEAAAFLHQHTVDLMFLDIKMPELTGLDFLKTLTNPPGVIITTAYSEYALEGYKYSVIDYLLKPIAFERFLKAVNKVIDRKEPAKRKPPDTPPDRSDDFIFLKSDKVRHKVLFSEIRYIEGCGNYIKVYTDDKMLIVPERMTAIETALPGELFLRVHKSYIVSLKRIEQVMENKIKIEDKMIPIGNAYKMKVNQIIKRDPQHGGGAGTLIARPGRHRSS